MQRHDHNDRPPSMVEEMRQTFGLVHGLMGCLCAPVAALTTVPGTIGERFMKLPMFLGLVAMILVLGLVPPGAGEFVPRGEQFVGLVGLYVLAFLVHRLAMNLRPRGAPVPHSMYTGRPPLGSDEVRIKGVVVPAVMLFIGMIVIVPMTGVGAWLVLASVSQAVCTEIYKRGIEAQVRAMRDARIEQGILLDKFRERENR